MAREMTPLALGARKRIVSVLLLALLLLIGLSPSALAKDYSFPGLKIQIDVAQDGSFTVIEERTFAFNGSFSWATYNLPLGYRYDIEDFSIQEGDFDFIRSGSGSPGTYELERYQESIFAKWYFSAKDEERTFTIKYKITGGIEAYSDLAQFYWKFVGTGWDKPVEEFEALVRLPKGARAEEIRAWAHGPLTGQVELIDGSTVRFSLKDLPAKTFVEGRIIFPLYLVSEVKSRFNEPIKETALAEEERWAKAANLAREEAILALEERKGLEKMGLASAIIASAVGLLFYIILWLMFGKEYPPSFNEDYYRELPAEYPPAIMGYLVKFGLVDEKDIVATLMDLARRGFFTIKEEAVTRKILFSTKTDYDYVLTRLAKESISLNSYESDLLKFLFDQVGDGQTVTIDQIQEFAQKKPMVSGRFLEGFKREVAKAAKAHAFLERRGSVIALNVFVSFMLIGFGFTIISIWQLSAGFITIALGILQIILSVFLKRRSPSAALDFKKWEAFKRFLLHFSNLKEALPASMVIWEHYLVYAVGLGVAEKTIEQLKVVMPDLLKEQGTVYSGPSWFESSRGLDGLSSLESFGQSLSNMVAIANSSMTSASGGGGGFSGGGGGGGGGSGGGAG